MRIAWYASRASWRQTWRVALLVALIGGLLGSVALGALAAARRTDSAYGRYLRAVNASDAMVDVPGPYAQLIRQIGRAPGTLSSAGWIGLNAYPVIDGKVDDSFLTAALTGALNGEFYRQDKVTVLTGRMPPPTATNEVVLTQNVADSFGTRHAPFRVGDLMTWQFFKLNPQTFAPTLAQRVTFRVAAIVNVSPALTDDFDATATAIIPPAATARFVSAREYAFGWATLRLRAGNAGVPALQKWLNAFAPRAQAEVKDPFPFTFSIRVLATVKHEAQQAIEQESVAVAALGALTALALLVLMAQGLAQLLSRSARDAPVLRAIGAGRGAAAMAAAGPGVVAVLGAVLLSIAGAIAISPLAPVGPVRQYDPVRGVQADWLVLGAGGAALLVLLALQLAWLAWRSVRQGRELAPVRPAALVLAASRAELPVPIVTGIRHALDRGTGRLRAPVRATLAGSIVAVTALVAALVFGASLTGLTTHPVRYGWNWQLMLQSSGGWGSWPPGAVTKEVAKQTGVVGWSELGFGQLNLTSAGRRDTTEVPVMGLQTYGAKKVEPPTTSGRPLAGANQIELGAVTMRQLGLHVGERVMAGQDPTPLTVVGTVTLPSLGVVLTDHPSLGRGAMVQESTLLSAEFGPKLHKLSNEQIENSPASPAFPSTMIFDVRSAADAHAVSKGIINWANAMPGNGGSLYPLEAKSELGAQVVNAGQMRGEPITLAAGVAAAAVLALGLTILASVRQRRRDLALLKALGLRARQVRAVIGWQTTTILLVAIVAGIPLGVAVGNWTWNAFANSIGFVAVPVVPVAALAGGLAIVLLAGNLLAAGPAYLAARIRPAATFRTE
jgi:hypothetical protein